MESVTKLLLKKNGTLLLHPAYTKPDEMIGYLTRYAPGREKTEDLFSRGYLVNLAYSLLKQVKILSKHSEDCVLSIMHESG